MSAIINKLEAALPALENRIEEITGIKVNLHAKTYTNRDGEMRYQFYSDDLAAELCGLAKPIFKQINITTWGGSITENTGGEETDYIWFSPKVEYHHYSGGSNGTGYIWSSLYFNHKTGEWDFERSRQYLITTKTKHDVNNDSEGEPINIHGVESRFEI